MSENLLSIKDLVVEYTTEGDIVQAVNGVDLTLRHGESLGLVGETGAGKTTTALAILGLLPDRTARIFCHSSRVQTAVRSVPAGIPEICPVVICVPSSRLQPAKV